MDISTKKNKKIISLVSMAHFYSHFFFFIFPPLFPLLKSDLEVSYIELGGIIVLFNLISALTQLPMGIVVDRLDAPKLLTFAVLCQAVSLLLISIYPFSKRWSNFPQVILGLTWGWVVPMSFTAVGRDISTVAVALYFSVVFWTIAFDTLYAMTDREEDIQLGVGSIAVYWAGNELRYIAFCQACFLILIAYCGYQFDRSWVFGSGIVITAICFLRQLWVAKSREKSDCYISFLNNHWVGMCIFLFTALDYWIID